MRRAAPVPFGTHAGLFAAAHAVVYNARERLQRDETVVTVSAALLVNLALFMALSFVPDPAGRTGAPGPGQGCSPTSSGRRPWWPLVAPWFFALQRRLLEMARAVDWAGRPSAAPPHRRWPTSFRTLRQPCRVQGRDSTRGSSPSTASWLSCWLILGGGLAYQQIIKGSIHHEQERQQNERRVIVPGTVATSSTGRAASWWRTGPRFAVVLYLDELRPDFRKAYVTIRAAYKAAGDQDLPTSAQIERLAHVSVVQQYMEQVNGITGRTGSVDAAALQRHLERQLLLPYTLVDDLKPEEFAKADRAPPRQLPPPGLHLEHALLPLRRRGGARPRLRRRERERGRRGVPGEGLTTLKMKGTVGRDGLEKEFDSTLQGEAGYTILRVDPAGYKVNPPIEHKLPVQGRTLATSLDIDLEQAAEDAIGTKPGRPSPWTCAPARCSRWRAGHRTT